MSDTIPFAIDIIMVAAAGLGVLIAQRVGQWTRIPFSALVLAIAAVAVAEVPGFHRPSQTVVVRIVTVALIAVLFAGGLGMGSSRLRSAVGPVLVLGVAGTFLTTVLGAIFIHYALRLAWYPSVLVATAVAPTDPAVVFSVLGQRPVAGRTATILEGESGANDPVGIALMAALIDGQGLTGHSLLHAAGTFAQEMAVGAAVGAAGGMVLLWLMRHVAVAEAGLDPIRTMAIAYLVYGLAALAHGSGFLAVFIAGIVVGDADVEHRAEIEQFHGSLGSIGEMAAFVTLGLTVHLAVLGRLDVWAPGIALGVALAVVIRPIAVRLCLLGAALSRPERRFLQFAGLKGAVPILLGTYLLSADLSAANRLYGLIVVVVGFSVVVQGGLIGPAASRLGLVSEPSPPEGLQEGSDPE